MLERKNLSIPIEISVSDQWEKTMEYIKQDAYSTLYTYKADNLNCFSTIRHLQQGETIKQLHFYGDELEAENGSGNVYIPCNLFIKQNGTDVVNHSLLINCENHNIYVVNEEDTLELRRDDTRQLVCKTREFRQMIMGIYRAGSCKKESSLMAGMLFKI